MNDATSGDSAPSLAVRALSVLSSNDVGTFIKPAGAQYPHQWNWDAALVALGLTQHDADRARLEVRSLLAGAWLDGMVPHILYHHGKSDYRPDPDFWRTAGHHPEGLPTSGLSQPPVLASCLLKMYQAAPTTEQGKWLAFLEEIFPTVLAWHRWWHETRDPEGSGLPRIVHPWESGSDDAPRFGAILASITPERPMPFTRADQVHVAREHRPSEEDYHRFIDLIDRYARLGWNSTAIQETTPFLVQDPFTIAVLHRANEDLKTLANLLGISRHGIDDWLHATQTAYQELWSPATETFEARDARTGELQQHAGFASFTALWAGLASERQAQTLAQRFASPSYRGPNSFQIPTTALDDPLFAPSRYWRGPVWIVINWLLAAGFKRYGYQDHAARLRTDALTLVDQHGFHEHYDPLDGTPGGAAAFSWSAALTLDLLATAAPAEVAA